MRQVIIRGGRGRARLLLQVGVGEGRAPTITVPKAAACRLGQATTHEEGNPPMIPTMYLVWTSACVAPMSIFGANLFSFNRVKERNADNKINKLNIKQMFAGQTHGPFNTF